MQTEEGNSDFFLRNVIQMSFKAEHNLNIKKEKGNTELKMKQTINNKNKQKIK